RHFPDPDDIFAACSAHFRALNPPPDPQTWLAIARPRERIHRALEQCYRYYRRNEQLLANVLRDRELGFPVGEGFLRHRAAATQALARGGLSDRQAVELTSALVCAALEPPCDRTASPGSARRRRATSRP